MSFGRWSSCVILTAVVAMAGSTCQPPCQPDDSAVFDVTVTVGGTGTGTVTKDPMDGPYVKCSVVELTAAANPGSVFVEWRDRDDNDRLLGSANPLNLTVDGEKHILAIFNLSGGGGGNGGTGGSGGLTITGMTADASHDLLYLAGSFGNDPGTVTIAGAGLTVNSWTADQIVCALPRGAFGDVIARAGDLFSNTAQLTKWQLHMVSHTVHMEPSQISGEFDLDIDVTLAIRACINNFLGSSTLSVSGAVSRSSTANISASGTIVVPPPGGHSSESLTASSPSSQSFQVIYPGDSGGDFTISNISCTASRATGGGGFHLLVRIDGYYNITTTIDGSPSTSQQGTGFEMNTFFDTTMANIFVMDSNYAIIAGSQPAKTDPNTVLHWDAAPAQAPPVDP